MLRAMLLIAVAITILVIIATQVILPMVVTELSLFWMFKKRQNEDVIITNEKGDQYSDLNSKAQEAKEEYLSVKNIIKKQKSKLDKIDKNSEM